MTRGEHILELGVAALAVVLLTVTVGCQKKPAGVMTTQEATAFVQQTLPIWNEGKFDVIDQLYASDYVLHRVDMGDDIIGWDAFRAYVTQVRTAFPDFHVTVDQVLVADDTVIVRWTNSGTNSGALDDQPPTGKTVQVSGVSVSRLADGKIAEGWLYYDELAIYRQLGYTLTPAPAAPSD